ncbi:ATP-dependent RNA helicase DbpA [Lampropedia aestuarii]|uniref:ATP-dependent RNA helicase DbpA n=1 Tax=Lampropedia aestuarii TaxID=2562762 RepID=A0A4S5BTT7_9BURK|nr:ATP-dependent RNA helicase DbpA [Lampropedia aestuarii]THJ33236.1 ATP-dependent RNA helicase DbpA [Lampropedia aestuarii]
MNAPTIDAANKADPTSFSQLMLGAAMQDNLHKLGYLQMTPIQAASLPLALQGKDVIAQASTGSGKTAAFGLALLARLNPRWFAVQSLVLCPTRELADQVATEIRRLARAEENIKVVTVYGGVPARNQIASLENGAHIIVGTPGRVMDLMERGAIDLSALNTFVLDEADRMLDMGFYADIDQVASQCPPERQTLLFSATYPDGIAQLAQRFMREPQLVKVAAQHNTHKIEQRWYEVAENERLHVVAQMLAHFRPESSIAFCNTKQQCRDLAEVLQAQGFSALVLFGELEQRERDEVLVQFSNRSCSVLVATDVAARGLDIANLEAVINVDTTPDPEVHIHRIGRTGRGDADGLALSLASMEEMGSVGRIELLQGRESEWHPVSELTPASSEPLVPAMRTIQIMGGRKEKIRAGDVLGAMTRDFGFAKEQVGKISVNDFSTYVAVSRSIANKVLTKLNNGRVKGKTVRARLL